MPDSPGKRDQLDGLNVVDGRPDADSEQRHWSDDKSNFKAIKKRRIAIGADHSWQMMAHRSKSSDKKEDVLRAPPRLRCGENRNQQHWRADKQQQVPPAIEDPKGGLRGRHNLGARNSRLRHCLGRHEALINQNRAENKLRRGNGTRALCRKAKGGWHCCHPPDEFLLYFELRTAWSG